MVRAHRSCYHWVAHYNVHITVQAKRNAKGYGWQWAAEEKLSGGDKVRKASFKKKIFEWCRISGSHLRDFLLHVCPAPSIWDIEVDWVKDPEHNNGTHRHIKACKDGHKTDAQINNKVQKKEQNVLNMHSNRKQGYNTSHITTKKQTKIGKIMLKTWNTQINAAGCGEHSLDLTWCAWRDGKKWFLKNWRRGSVERQYVESVKPEVLVQN